MSNQKIKSENYQNFGGINQKVSPHDTGIFEFLDLSNLDFQTPGSLSQRWGSTMYVGQTFPGPIHSIFEFAKLDGSSYVVESYSGGIFYGATTGQGQGISGAAVGTSTQYYASVNYLAIHTPVPSGINSAYMYPIGANFNGGANSQIYGYGDGTVTPSLGNTFYLWPSFIQSDNRLSCAVLNNFMFAADGNKFVKFDGATITPVGVPPVLWATNGAFDIRGNVSGDRGFGSITGASSGGIGFQYGPSFGLLYLFASYINNRGFEGPAFPLLAINLDSQFNASLTINIPAMGATGIMQASLILATPLAYGISAINIYSYYDPYNTSIGQTYTNFIDNKFLGNVSARFWNLQSSAALLQSVPASGTTFTSFGLGGATTAGQTLIQANLQGPLIPTTPNTYLPVGFTLGITTSPANYYQYGAITGVFPTMLETYQNRLFSAGFSLARSTVRFSDISEPEGYAPDFNFEVRTNDGDFITCMRAYSTRLYIFKQRSFHILTGDNPNDFEVDQITDQYGCLNNRCAVLYNDLMVFLDRKGVVLWNGAGLTPLSDPKIKPIFDRMNFQAALTEACMVHDKIRSQILIAIPVDGSTTNNIMVVYDYLAGAWTSYKNFSASALAQVSGRNTTKNAFFGDYLGRLNWFGASFGTDNGATIIPYWKTRFLHDLGDSTSKTYRRLFLDTDAPGTSTNAFRIDFYQNYGPSIVLSTTMTLTGTQSRIDFGIQNSKSVAFELTGLQMALPLRIHGFTLESRFTRRV